MYSFEEVQYFKTTVACGCGFNFNFIIRLLVPTITSDGTLSLSAYMWQKYTTNTFFTYHLLFTIICSFNHLVRCNFSLSTHIVCLNFASAVWFDTQFCTSYCSWNFKKDLIITTVCLSDTLCVMLTLWSLSRDAVTMDGLIVCQLCLACTPFETPKDTFVQCWNNC